MRLPLFIFISTLLSCNTDTKKPGEATADSNFIPIKLDTSIVIQDSIQEALTESYENKRFRDVTVTKFGDSFRIKGKAQVFEASFSWLIEDGHNELQYGHEMTDAGAPAWGSFDFIVKPPTPHGSGIMHLILFEASAKDGSRQHLLPIPLK